MVRKKNRVGLSAEHHHKKVELKGIESLGVEREVEGLVEFGLGFHCRN